MLFDSHAHLDDRSFKGDLEAVLERSRDAGVTRIVTVGTDAASSKRAVEIASAHDWIDAAVGSHPHTADTVKDVEALRPLVDRSVAVGETGLDYFKGYADKDNQKQLFIAHMNLAREAGRPIIIHCRDAHEDCRAMLREHLGDSVRGVIHCFTGTAEDAADYVSLGMYLSIAGPVTYPKAEPLREAARTIPLDRLLVETDCPLLTPQTHRGKRNEPAYVRFTAEKLADLHGVSVDKLAEFTSCNAEKLFARS